MADWRRIFEVDLVGAALLAEALRPLAPIGMAMVYFAPMSPTLANIDESDPELAAILDDPLAPDFLEQIREALGPSVEASELACPCAKHGVHGFARREAVRLGPAGARACSFSPGIMATPQGNRGAKHASMQRLIDMTPLGRTGVAEDVASVLAFLVSDDARFVNGIDILVDGGVFTAVREAQTRG